MYYGWKHNKTLTDVIKIIVIVKRCIKSTPQNNSKVTDS